MREPDCDLLKRVSDTLSDDRATLHSRVRRLWLLTVIVGLGINCSYWVEKGVISEDTKRSRDRVFWTTYVQDKCVSLQRCS